MKNPFVITIKMGSETLTGSGETVLEALRSIKAPTKITCKGVFLMTHGDKKKEILFQPVQLRRLFYPKAQTILVKSLGMAMK